MPLTTTKTMKIDAGAATDDHHRNKDENEDRDEE